MHPKQIRSSLKKQRSKEAATNGSNFVIANALISILRRPRSGSV
jgi:hypothetical protein